MAFSFLVKISNLFILRAQIFSSLEVISDLPRRGKTIIYERKLLFKRYSWKSIFSLFQQFTCMWNKRHHKNKLNSHWNYTLWCHSSNTDFSRFKWSMKLKRPLLLGLRNLLSFSSPSTLWRQSARGLSQDFLFLSISPSEWSFNYNSFSSFYFFHICEGNDVAKICLLFPRDSGDCWVWIYFLSCCQFSESCWITCSWLFRRFILRTQI